MLVLLGKIWSKRQEYDLERAKEYGVPIVGILLDGVEVKAINALTKSQEIPVVNWSWSNLADILAGNMHSLDYVAQKSPLPLIQKIETDFTKISEELTAHLLDDPNAMHQISPRKFEELVAYLMERHGYEVNLTQQSRDGGIDIFGLKSDGFGNILTIVDCKKYSPNNPVRIEAVRRMYGILQAENASHGMIATTSRFTPDAKKYASRFEYQLSLKNHSDILQWIQKTK